MQQLPSAPASAGRILAVAVSDMPDFQELVAAVEADPAVSLRVLRLANTAGFNRSEKVEDIRQAAMLLGTDALRQAALCVCVRDGLFGSFDQGDPLVRSFWKHSLACACAARLLAGLARKNMAGAAFAAGLVHDCGKLALLSAVPGQYAPLLGQEFLAGERLVRAEQETLGADHCLAGKWLLERWGLPEAFAQAAWSHHQPLGVLAGQAGRDPLSLIAALADRLAHEAMGALAAASRDPAMPEAARALGLDPDAAFAEVLAGIGQHFARSASLFELGQDAASFYFEALGRANRRLGQDNISLAGKGAGLERDAQALKRVALAGVDIVGAGSPEGVLSALASHLRDGFGAPSGLACLVDPGQRAAEGVAWADGGSARVSVPLEADLSPSPGAAKGLPPGLAAHLAGCRLRASALAGPEGPPVHFLDGVCMVSITQGQDVLGEVLFTPRSGSVSPEERSALSLLAQLCAQAFRGLDLVRRCEARSERLAQLMRSMQDMNDKLLRTQRLAAVGQLAAGAAHEINNPLAIISARAQLLEMREEDPAKKKGLRQMVEQIERISAILGSLMDFARPAPPRIEDVNPAEVLDRVLGFLEGGLRSQGIGVVRDYAPDLPALRADGRQLEQVLLNLALNAQHAMEGLGGTLTARIAWHPESDVVALRIADTGTGIDAVNLDKIFDPFFTTKAEGKGTGLGLSTAYGIVQAHKGRITVKSEPGKGAVFTVALPRDPGAPPRPRPAAGDARQARHILVADDEAHIRDILRESLESSGYQVELAEDGGKALDLIRANRYRLLVLDIRMPGRDGLSVLREAAAFLPAGMPVLVLTGMASDEELAQARELGATACMRKPFQVDALLAQVASLLGGGDPR